MIVGVPKEIKNHEYRVGLTPSSVKELTTRGHAVLVQANAGAEIGLSDEEYVAAGATIVATAKEIFERAEMIVKVKEPQPVECAMLRPGQIPLLPGATMPFGSSASLTRRFNSSSAPLL